MQPESNRIVSRGYHPIKKWIFLSLKSESIKLDNVPLELESESISHGNRARWDLNKFHWYWSVIGMMPVNWNLTCGAQILTQIFAIYIINILLTTHAIKYKYWVINYALIWLIHCKFQRNNSEKFWEIGILMESFSVIFIKYDKWQPVRHSVFRQIVHERR